MHSCVSGCLYLLACTPASWVCWLANWSLYIIVVSLCPTRQQNKWWKHLQAQTQCSLTKRENNNIATVLNTMSHTQTEIRHPIHQHSPTVSSGGESTTSSGKTQTFALSTSKWPNWMQNVFYKHLPLFYVLLHTTVYRKQEQTTLMLHVKLRIML